MRLHVEDELLLRPFLLKRFLIVQLGGVHLVAIAKHLVEGHQRRCHAAAGTQKVAAAQTLMPRRLFADLGQAGLDLLLLGRLRRRNKLLIGSDTRRDRRRGFELSIKFALAYPHG